MSYNLTSMLPVQGRAPGPPKEDIPGIPPLQIPTGPPRSWDRGALIKRVRVGMMIELSTIPLYLYAMYSVDPAQKQGTTARTGIGGVLQQEMLHLALVGNLLTSIGGTMDLYDARIVPQYPGKILMASIPLSLEPLSAESLGHFMEIESASEGYEPSPPENRKVLASGYSSIGELYEDLITGIRGLKDEVFSNNPDQQFDGNSFFGPQLFPITDQASALSALKTIIEQGEGNLSVVDSHYDVFSNLYSDPDSWVTYGVPLNPTTAKYKGDPYIYRLSLSFDAAYCYLLQNIQRVWQTSDIQSRRLLIRNTHALMNNVLTPLSDLLLKQKWKDGCAAPCFNFYTTKPAFAPLPPTELWKALLNELNQAAALATPPPDLDSDQFILKRIHAYVNDKITPETTTSV